MNITGTNKGDKLIGTDAIDFINGGGGYDQITGGLGADILTGGVGTDAFRGKLVEHDGDTITDYDGDRIVVLGADLAQSDLSSTVENGATLLRLKDATLKLEGVTSGGFVADARGGYTVITFDAAAEPTTEPTAEPPSETTPTTPPAPATDAPDPVPEGSDPDTTELNIITGTSKGDKLVGTDAADFINGGGGYDQITGGLGADILTGGVGTDAFRGKLAEHDGDTITDYDGDRIVVLGADLAQSDLSSTVENGATLLRLKDATLKLEGVTSGGFVADARGGYTVVTFDPTAKPTVDDSPQNDDTLDLMIIGDSFTIPSRGFPGMLDSELDKFDYDVNIIAFSKSGDTAQAALVRLESYFGDASNTIPDAAVVMLGINDALQAKPFNQTMASLEGIIDIFDQHDIEVLLARPDSFFPLRPDWKPQGYADPQDQAAFAKLYDDLVAQQGTLFEPQFTDGLAELDTDLSLLESDQFHPSQSGSALMVENILPEVKQLLDLTTDPSVQVA